ncbi:hypothetical protein LJD48_28310, partial [Escherichia coli]|nr:hypothetical protein [Escherichia coli]
GVALGIDEGFHCTFYRGNSVVARGECLHGRRCCTEQFSRLAERIGLKQFGQPDADRGLQACGRQRTGRERTQADEARIGRRV